MTVRNEYYCMCLAIASNRKLSNGFISRLWRAVSSTPLRLLSFCAFFHSLVLGGLFIHNVAIGSLIDMHAYMFGLTYGILALLAFGYLLSWIPKKYSLSPVHYGRYNVIYLLMMIALGILEIGIFFSSNWILAGMLLFIPAWLVALQSLWNLHIWINADAQQPSKILMLLLSINFINLSLSLIGQFFSASMLTTLATSTSTLLLWPLLVAAAFLLLLTAPAKGRVISL